MQSFWTAQQIQGSRPYQEDFFAIVENNAIFYQGQTHPLKDPIFPSQQTLYILTDGMGGMGNGDVAAAQVTQSFISHYLQQLNLESSISEKLNTALHLSNNLLAETVEKKPEYKGMGCTLIAVIWDNQKNSIYWVSVGDSPLWLYRQQQLIRLNAKHTWGELAKTKKIHDPNMNRTVFRGIADMLVSAVDGQYLEYVDLPTEAYSMQSGDLLLLASDGMETLSCQQIELKLSSFNSKQSDTDIIFTDLNAKCDALIDEVEAEKNPHQDNASLILGLFY